MFGLTGHVLAHNSLYELALGHHILRLCPPATDESSGFSGPVVSAIGAPRWPAVLSNRGRHLKSIPLTLTLPQSVHLCHHFGPRR